MKYIDFESWTITWLHEGHVIVEDQLTHSGSRTGVTLNRQDQISVFFEKRTNQT